MDIKQFKALIETYEAAGLNLGEAYFLIKHNQAEQHHKEMLKVLERVSLPTYILEGDDGPIRGYEVRNEDPR